MYRYAQFSLILFLLNGLIVRSQSVDTLSAQLKIPGTFDYIAADPLGYIYAVKGEEVYKFNEKGDTLYQQSSKQYGTVSHLDASQSMRILLYFENQQAIGFTDNTLSWHKTPQSLNSSNVPFPTAVCQSFLDNNLWVYDDATSSLLKLNTKLEVIQRNENMPAMLGQPFSPIFMMEQSDKLYVLDSVSGIFVFDLFGSLNRHFKMKGVQKIDVKNGNIFFLKKDKIYPFMPLEPIQVPIKTDGIKQIKDFALLDKKVAILSKKGIYILSRKR